MVTWQSTKDGSYSADDHGVDDDHDVDDCYDGHDDDDDDDDDSDDDSNRDDDHNTSDLYSQSLSSHSCKDQSIDANYLDTALISVPSIVPDQIPITDHPKW